MKASTPKDWLFDYKTSRIAFTPTNSFLNRGHKDHVRLFPKGDLVIVDTSPKAYIIPSSHINKSIRNESRSNVTHTNKYPSRAVTNFSNKRHDRFAIAMAQ